MTTIEEARHSEDWVIKARLVHKLLFFTTSKRTNENSVVLVLLFIDRQGTQIELKTWNPNKCHYVYKKFNEDETYVISGAGSFESPSREYSTSKYTTRRWYIDESDDKLRLKNHINCSTNLGKLLRDLKQDRPANLVAIFDSYGRGPVKYYNNRPSIRGYFIKLIDDEGNLFRALVWHTSHIKHVKNPLLQCQQGDIILLTSVRMSSYDSSGGGDQLYTFTTTSPPVVNPSCVSSRRLQDLQRVGR